MPVERSIESIVIAGAGLAGATAARTLRTEGFSGRITLVGAKTPSRWHLRRGTPKTTSSFD
jgi:2-polyprenyl-6-methoxyphenol hydroxylase-like FAD-dependent oxidoreductase